MKTAIASEDDWKMTCREILMRIEAEENREDEYLDFETACQREISQRNYMNPIQERLVEFGMAGMGLRNG